MQIIINLNSTLVSAIKGKYPNTDTDTKLKAHLKMLIRDVLKNYILKMKGDSDIDSQIT